MMWPSLVIILFTPTVSRAFDYGPVWNDLFWIALAAWSMAVSYMLLKKRHRLWAFISSLTHALLTPGVHPARTHSTRHVRNPHIVAEVHTSNTSSHGAIPAASARIHVTNTPPHTAPKQHEYVHVLPQRPTIQQRAQSVPAAAPNLTGTQSTTNGTTTAPPAQPVVHSTHMSHTTHPTPPAPHTVPPASIQTSDTLTLEIIAGVPKLILKREVKK